MEPDEELTYGQALVGVRFNPSARPDVDTTKQSFADVIDMLVALGHPALGSDPLREMVIEQAIVQVATAQMWAVKALTMDD